MAVTLQVLYPTTAGTTFDYDYYTNTHLAMVGDHMGAHIESAVAIKGDADGAGDAPGFYVIATLTFADQAAMDAALAKAGPVLEDIANFTSTAPQMLVGHTL